LRQQHATVLASATFLGGPTQISKAEIFVTWLGLYSLG